MILDEPTSALDPVGRADTRVIIRHLRDRGCAVFLNSHLLGEVEQICDRAAVVSDGRVLAIGRLDELLGSGGVRIRLTGMTDTVHAALARRGRVAEHDGWFVVDGVDAESVPDLVAERGLERRPCLCGRAGAPDARGALPHPHRNRAGAMAALTIARLTIREAARRKLLLALAVLTVIVIGLTGWGFQHLTTLTNPDGSQIPHDELRLATSQVLVLVEFMFSGVLALSAVVVASPAISSELESGVALSIFARPVSRYQVVLGKWLGLAALIVFYVVATTTLELVVVDLTTGYVPPGPVGLAAYLSGEGVVVMSLALLISTRLSGMTAGVISLVLFFIAWIGGIAGAIGEVFSSSAISNAGTITQLLLPTDALWRGSVYELEPVLYRDVLGATTERAGNPFFVQSPPSLAFLTWSVCWVVLIVSLTVWSLHRREV